MANVRLWADKSSSTVSSTRYFLRQGLPTACRIENRHFWAEKAANPMSTPGMRTLYDQKNLHGERESGINISCLFCAFIGHDIIIEKGQGVKLCAGLFRIVHSGWGSGHLCNYSRFLGSIPHF